MFSNERRDSSLLVNKKRIEPNRSFRVTNFNQEDMKDHFMRCFCKIMEVNIAPERLCNRVVSA